MTCCTPLPAKPPSRRAGTPRPAERDALVREVLSRDDLKYCPHGRPICMTLRRRPARSANSSGPDGSLFMEKIICVVGPTASGKTRPVHPPGPGAGRRGSLLRLHADLPAAWTLAPPSPPRRRCSGVQHHMLDLHPAVGRTTPSPALSRKRNLILQDILSPGQIRHP